MLLSRALPPADGPLLADLLLRVVTTVSAVSAAGAALGVETCLDSSLCSAANLDEARVGVLTAASSSPPVRLLSAAALLTDSDVLGGDLVAALGV